MTEQTNPTNSVLQQLLEEYGAAEEAIFTMSVVADRCRSFKKLADDLHLMMAPEGPTSLELEGASWLSELHLRDTRGSSRADEIRKKHEIVLSAAQEIGVALERHQAALVEAGGIEGVIRQKQTAYEAACELDHVISMDVAIRMGKPCIQGLRISAYDVLDYLRCGMTRDEILFDYPDLREEHIDACLSFATYVNGRMTADPAA